MWLILGGHIFFQTLSAAAELDLFNILAKHPGLTRQEIAEKLGVQEKPVRILLLGCMALELVQKKVDKYYNSRLAKMLLTNESSQNILSVIKWQHHINYKALFHFFEAIKANKNVGLEEFAGAEATLYERLAHNPRLEKIFQDAMEDISIQANKYLKEYLDLSSMKFLVDVGGGNGKNIIALAKKYPHLKAAVFDSPSVCEIARENIQKSGLANRLSAIVGNCFVDPFPKEADCLMFAHFFTIWSESNNYRLLRKCFESLPEGGSVILFNMMQSNRENGPLSAAMGSPYFLTLASGEGMIYTWKEYEQWMREAGFSQVKKIELPTDHGIIIGVK